MGIEALNVESVLGVSGRPVLVGGGSDGATVNIADRGGLKGMMQHSLPWLHLDPRFKICLFPFHASANSVSEPKSPVFTGFSEVLASFFLPYFYKITLIGKFS